MNIQAYTNFRKRKNSTKQPSGGTTISVALKEPTSDVSPIFLLNASSKPAYTYIRAFGNYYYVDSINPVTATHFEIICSLDPLASYKEDIGNTNAYIERCFTGWKPKIYDRARTVYNEWQEVLRIRATYESRFDYDEHFLLTTTGASGGAAIGLTTYVLTYSQLKDAISWAFNKASYQQTFQDFLNNQGAESWFNPMQYIISLKMAPYDFGGFTGQSSTVKFGWWDTGVSALELTEGKASLYYNIPLSQVTTAAAADVKWFSNDSTYDLYLPGCGSIALDPYDIGECSATANNIFIRYGVDLTTGECDVKIFAYSGSGVAINSQPILGSTRGNLFVDIPLSNNKSQVTEATSSYLGAIGSALRLDFGGVASGLIEGTRKATTPTPQAQGSASGNRTVIYDLPYPVLTVRVPRVSPSPIGVIGGPFCEIGKISEHGPFVQTRAASVESSAYGPIKDQINAYLDGGIYYE